MADWKSLTDREWVNIVNSDAVKSEGDDVHGAVCAAFKLIEAKLREKNEPKTALDHFIDDVEAAEKLNAEKFLPALPDVGYLGDDVSYGYDSTDMRGYALEAVRAAIAAIQATRGPTPPSLLPHGSGEQTR